MKATFDFEYKGHPVSMIVNDAHIAAEMLKEKTFYEHWLLNVIERYFLLNPHLQGTFVDVGANTGNHSVFFAKFCGAEVIAIEPLEDSFNILCINGMNNCDGKIEAVHRAIAGVEFTGRMVVPTDERSIGGSTLVEDKRGDVKVTTLDKLLEKYKQPIRLIKVDVEGGEIDVVCGGLGIIQQYKPELFIETWSASNLKALESLLSPFGYEMKERYCHAPVYHFSVDKDIKRTFRP